MPSRFYANPGETLKMLFPERPSLQDWQQGNFAVESPYIHIIRHLLAVIQTTPKCCVEFGAWDGVRYSQTRPLVTENGWRACYIEGDAERFSALKANYSPPNDVTAEGGVVIVNRMVGFDDNDNLDSILANEGFEPTDIGLVVIDIDGNDYHVWKAVEKFSPPIVVIEYNCLIPNNIIYIQPRDMTVQKGSSLQAMIELGREKGYELVAAPGVDAFFVKKEYYPLFDLIDNSPNALNHNDRYLTTMFQTYDGEFVCAGYDLLHWDNIHFTREDIQPLPKTLRHYCGPGQVKCPIPWN